MTRRLTWLLMTASCSAPATMLEPIVTRDGGDAGAPADAGSDAGSPDAGARALCPPDGGWVTLAPLGAGPRQETGVAALGDEVFVVGGFDQNGAFLPRVEAYRWRTNSWRTTAPLPVAMHHVNLAAFDGKLYALGGLGQSFVALGNAYVYDPAADSWSPVPSMPAGTQRGGGAVGVVEGRIVIAGGYRLGSVRDVSAYQPGTDTWSALPSLPVVARDHLVGAVWGTTFYALGGRTNGAIDGRVDAMPADPPGWVGRTAMLTPRAGAAAAVRGSEVVVLGGEGNGAASSGVFPQAEVYDLVNDRWSSEAPIPTPRHGTGAAAIDGVVFFPGGATVQGFGAVDTHEALCPR
jgi:N-acetylneuraminic acid mutarotase